MCLKEMTNWFAPPPLAALTDCFVISMPRGRRLAKKAALALTKDESPASRAYKAMVCDEALLGELGNTPTPENTRRVGEIIRAIWSETNTSIPAHPEIVSNFFSWAGKESISVPQLFRETMEKRRSMSTQFHARKRRAINLSNLNPQAVNKEAYLSLIPIRKCRRLAVAFPPPRLYVSETEEIYKRNAAFVLERELPDNRIPRKNIFQLDNPGTWDMQEGIHGLEHDLGPGDSARFEDQNGDLIAIVIRGACRDRRIVQFMDNSIAQTVATRRNLRKEDNGHISQMGFSTGSRSRPKLGWVQNIEHRKHDKDLHEKVNYDASSSFVILWSMVRSLLPDMILDDFATFLDELGPDLRMDGDGSMKTSSAGRGTYHIDINGVDMEFHNTELAPPCGVMAENHCRYIHFENQPHTWAVSLTTSRSFDPAISSLDAGGHFYISSFGIRIQAAPNTLIAWRPKDWHGTSLLHTSPEARKQDGVYCQRELGIVTGNRVFNAVKKWRAGMVVNDNELDSVELGSWNDHGRANELDDSEFVEAL